GKAKVRGMFLPQLHLLGVAKHSVCQRLSNSSLEFTCIIRRLGLLTLLAALAELLLREHRLQTFQCLGLAGHAVRVGGASEVDATQTNNVVRERA
ncbi:MAG: hypothetical protein R6V12_14395, partial [Candidatus Hydrogenedentota bacterium]